MSKVKQFFTSFGSKGGKITIVLSLFILFLLVSGYLFVQKSKSAPEQMALTTVSPNGFTISFFTNRKTGSSIEVSPNSDFKDSKVFYDTRDTTIQKATPQNRTNHVLVVSGLEPEKTYHYRVKTSMNTVSGKDYSFTTPSVPSKIPAPRPLYGQVINKDGKPLQNALITAFLRDKTTGESSRLTTYTAENGSYSLDLSNLRRSTNYSELFPIGNAFEVNVQASTLKEAYYIVANEKSIAPVKTFMFEKTSDTNASSIFPTNEKTTFEKLVSTSKAQSCDSECTKASEFEELYNECSNNEWCQNNAQCIADCETRHSQWNGAKSECDRCKSSAPSSPSIEENPYPGCTKAKWNPEGNEYYKCLENVAQDGNAWSCQDQHNYFIDPANCVNTKNTPNPQPAKLPDDYTDVKICKMDKGVCTVTTIVKTNIDGKIIETPSTQTFTGNTRCDSAGVSCVEVIPELEKDNSPVLNECPGGSRKNSNGTCTIGGLECKVKNGSEYYSCRGDGGRNNAYDCVNGNYYQVGEEMCPKNPTFVDTKPPCPQNIELNDDQLSKCICTGKLDTIAPNVSKCLPLPSDPVPTKPTCNYNVDLSETELANCICDGDIDSPAPGMPSKCLPKITPVTAKPTCPMNAELDDVTKAGCVCAGVWDEIAPNRSKCMPQVTPVPQCPINVEIKDSGVWYNCACPGERLILPDGMTAKCIVAPTNMSNDKNAKCPDGSFVDSQGKCFIGGKSCNVKNANEYYTCETDGSINNAYDCVNGNYYQVGGDMCKVREYCVLDTPLTNTDCVCNGDMDSPSPGQASVCRSKVNPAPVKPNCPKGTGVFLNDQEIENCVCNGEIDNIAPNKNQCVNKTNVPVPPSTTPTKTPSIPQCPKAESFRGNGCKCPNGGNPIEDVEVPGNYTCSVPFTCPKTDSFRSNSCQCPDGGKPIADVEVSGYYTCNKPTPTKTRTSAPTKCPGPGPCAVDNGMKGFASLLSSAQAKSGVSIDAVTGQELPAGIYRTDTGLTINLVSPTIVKFFIDTNGNNIKDDGEEEVAEQVYTLIKQGDGFEYELLNGWNALNFPFFKDDNGNFKTYMASDIRALAEGQGLNVTSIKKWNGNWEEYTLENGTVYGQDFEILPNQGYFLRSNNSGTLRLLGVTPTEAMPAQLLNGWSLIGVAPGYAEDKRKVYTHANFEDGIQAFELMDTINGTDAGFNIDNVTKFESGLYKGVNYGNGNDGNKLKFGIDFDINDVNAYFVRSYKKSIFVP